MLNAHARGKLLLFGEHAAVYGHPALGCALAEGIAVRWQPANAGADPVGTFPLPWQAAARACLERLASIDAALDLREGQVCVEASLSSAGGFGSSAAFAVALVRLALIKAGREHKSAEIWFLANELERQFHARPSGIDTGIATFEGLVSFQRSANAPSAALPQATCHAMAGIHLVYGAVPRQGNTRDIVQNLGRRLQAGDSLCREAIQHLGELAATSIAGLGSPQFPTRLPQLSGEAEAMLETLGLGHTEHRALFAHAAALGFPGGKASGAGCGGAFWIPAPDPASASELARELNAYAAASTLCLSIPCQALST